jgi:hypothetical protein
MILVHQMLALLEPDSGAVFMNLLIKSGLSVSCLT